MVCTSCAWKTPCYHCTCASASPESERMPWYSHAVCCITNPSFQMPEQKKTHTAIALPSSHEQRTRFTRHKILLLFVWSFYLCLQRGACCWAGAMHSRLYHSIATMWCLCERDLCKVFALRDRIHILRFCLCLFTLSRAHTQSACGSATTDRYVPKTQTIQSVYPFRNKNTSHWMTNNRPTASVTIWIWSIYTLGRHCSLFCWKMRCYKNDRSGFLMHNTPANIVLSTYIYV